MKVDITPPPDTPVTGHPRKTSGSATRSAPGILLLDDGKTKAAIATLDLIGASDALVGAVREAISSKAGIPREHPGRGLAQPLRPGFREASGRAKQVAGKIATAAAEAARTCGR